MNQHPTKKELKKIFHYDTPTGQLFRKEGTYSTASVGSQDHGYLRVTLRGRSYYAHRIIWCMVYGVWPDTIDHIDGDGTNNRLSNMRSVTQAENCRNAKLSSSNKSGFSGVSLFKRTGKWSAYIKKDYKKLHLGYYDTIEEAVNARADAETVLSFHVNHGRS